MSTLDEKLERVLSELSQFTAKDGQNGSRILAAEFNRRDKFLTSLRDVLRQTPFDGVEIASRFDHEMEVEGKHRSGKLWDRCISRRNIRRLFTSASAASEFGRLSDGSATPDAGAVQSLAEWIDKHSGMNRHNVTFITSLLLNALFPTEFAETAVDRWVFMAKHFPLEKFPKQGSHSERILAGADRARTIAQSTAFRRHFGGKEPLRRVGTLAYVLDRKCPEILKRAQPRT